MAAGGHALLWIALSYMKVGAARASGLLVLAAGWIAGLLASAALLAWVVVRKYRDRRR